MNAFIQLLFNPAILSLFVGFVSGIFTKLSFPKKLMEVVSIYLIFTIGFKGGGCLGEASQCSTALYSLLLVGIIIGFLQPFLHYFILKKTTDLDKQNAAVVATEYGSISIVTFITALTFLNKHNVVYDNFMTAIAGIMEIPALFSGLFILKHKKNTYETEFFKSIFSICKAIVTCKKISFIFVGFFVGYIFKLFNVLCFNEIILAPFTVMLVIFMLDIGLKIASQRSYIKHIKIPLFAFGIYMPIINGIFALLIASRFVSNVGSLLLFALLIASASYIAAPAVMRTQAKDAKEAIYMPLTLGITLPFNIIFGIPIFYYLAKLLI